MRSYYQHVPGVATPVLVVPDLAGADTLPVFADESGELAELADSDADVVTQVQVDDDGKPYAVRVNTTHGYAPHTVRAIGLQRWQGVQRYARANPQQALLAPAFMQRLSSRIQAVKSMPAMAGLANLDPTPREAFLVDMPGVDSPVVAVPDMGDRVFQVAMFDDGEAVDLPHVAGLGDDGEDSGMTAYVGADGMGNPVAVLSGFPVELDFDDAVGIGNLGLSKKFWRRQKRKWSNVARQTKNVLKNSLRIVGGAVTGNVDMISRGVKGHADGIKDKVIEAKNLVRDINRAATKTRTAVKTAIAPILPRLPVKLPGPGTPAGPDPFDALLNPQSASGMTWTPGKIAAAIAAGLALIVGGAFFFSRGQAQVSP